MAAEEDEGIGILEEEFGRVEVAGGGIMPKDGTGSLDWEDADEPFWVNAAFRVEFIKAGAVVVLDDDAPVLGATHVGNRGFGGPNRCAMDILDESFVDNGTWGRLMGCEVAALEFCALD